MKETVRALFIFFRCTRCPLVVHESQALSVGPGQAVPGSLGPLADESSMDYRMCPFSQPGAAVRRAQGIGEVRR